MRLPAITRSCGGQRRVRPRGRQAAYQRRCPPYGATRAASENAMASPQTVRSEARRVRPVRLCAPEVVVERKPDGTLHLKSSRVLPGYPDKLTDRLVYWAEQTPGRVFMAERPGGQEGGWRTLTYADT